MIVVVGGQKGGSGKSTTAINLAVELIKRDFNVCLLESDKQPTTSTWAKRRKEKPELAHIDCFQKYGNISIKALELNGRYDCVIVDTSGKDSYELRVGLTVADMLICPIKPSQADLDTLPTVYGIVKKAMEINKRLIPKTLITMAPTNPKITETAETRHYLGQFQGMEPLEAFIKTRKVYRDTLSDGLGVVESSNKDAKQEIEALTSEVLSHLWNLKRKDKEISKFF